MLTVIIMVIIMVSSKQLLFKKKKSLMYCKVNTIILGLEAAFCLLGNNF